MKKNSKTRTDKGREGDSPLVFLLFPNCSGNSNSRMDKGLERNSLYCSLSLTLPKTFFLFIKKPRKIIFSVCVHVGVGTVVKIARKPLHGGDFAVPGTVREPWEHYPVLEGMR